jgi:hypothetical protein
MAAFDAKAISARSWAPGKLCALKGATPRRHCKLNVVLGAPQKASTAVARALAPNRRESSERKKREGRNVGRSNKNLEPCPRVETMHQGYMPVDVVYGSNRGALEPCWGHAPIHNHPSVRSPLHRRRDFKRARETLKWYTTDAISDRAVLGERTSDRNVSFHPWPSESVSGGCRVI